MTTDKRGLSALLLQRQFGLLRYETAWMMLHKFRRAMVNLEREPLRAEVEVDDAWIGGVQAGLRQPATQGPEGGTRYRCCRETRSRIWPNPHGGCPGLQERYSECLS
jgi:hypothetical protein